MLFPEVDKMIEVVGSKYLLVTAAAKRARQIKDGSLLTIHSVSSHKEVGMALEEIVTGKIVLQEKQDEEQEEKES